MIRRKRACDEEANNAEVSPMRLPQCRPDGQRLRDRSLFSRLVQHYYHTVNGECGNTTYRIPLLPFLRLEKCREP